MIKKIKLHNFKCYKDEEFNLSNLTVFCGNNSVGKSTAIQALILLLQSKFEKEIPFNGDLISLGKYKEVRNYYNEEDETLWITLTNSLDKKIQWEYPVDKNIDILVRESAVDKVFIDDLQNFLSNFQYIEAERYGPRDNYNANLSNMHDDWLGSKGEYTSEVLAKIAKNKRFQHMNAETGELITNKNDSRIHETVSSYQIDDSILAWMNDISPGFTFQSQTVNAANISFNSFEHNNSGKTIRPSNVGFGLSYVLSVVTALLNAPVGGLIIIENPEAHLHPRGQSYLGRLIALTAEAGVQVIVETHSDHIINGIRVIVRIKEGVNPDLFKLCFISHNLETNENLSTEITIDDKGKLSSWPKGFFDQQVIDMTTIVTGK